MARIVDSILMEFDQEAATTKKVLERVPADKLSWKPHEKSMSLGELALHVATTPGQIASLVMQDGMDIAEVDGPGTVASAEELISAYRDSVTEAKKILNGLEDDTMMSTWKVTKDGQEMMAFPRIGVIRSIMLNHWYHHRGQLSVYLRLLDVPVPSIYGPSADEDPWAD